MMERAEVGRIADEALASLVATPPENARSVMIRITSGTSGAPLVVATTYDPSAPDDITGDTQASTMLTCVGSRTARLANMLVARSASRNVRILALDSDDIGDGLERVVTDVEPDAVHGFPAFILRMAEHVPGDVRSRIRVVKTTGELLSGAVAQTLESEFPRAKKEQVYLASEVAGRIGIQSCPHLRRNQFHPADGVEVALESPDETGIGALIVSKTIFREFRVDNYKIGDMARMLVPCTCGAPVSFELFGRSGTDYIKVEGALLVREELERVLDTAQDIVCDYRAEAGSRESDGARRGYVKLHVVCKGGKGTDLLAKELAERIQRALYMTGESTYEMLVERGVFEPLEVEFVDNVPPMGHKDAKLFYART